MEPHCAFCYAPTERLLTCGKCHGRRFCSKECQIQDWKLGHRQYCGKSGQIGVDFEIRPCSMDNNDNNKGLGVFALRSFRKNEKVMVERPLLLFPTSRTPLVEENKIPPSAKAAVDALLPRQGSLAAKLLLNGMSCSGDNDNNGGMSQTGLFITMSRMNHHCIGNTDHQYVDHWQVKILVASRDIERGEEITISYSAGKAPWRRIKLRANYGFDCTCSCCTDPECDAKLTRISNLDEEILQLASRGQVEQAMRKGRALLALYDNLHMSDWLYFRTYYDLFQVAITKKKHVPEGKTMIQNAYQAVLAYTEDEHHPDVKRMKGFVDHPESHRNYLLLLK